MKKFEDLRQILERECKTLQEECRGSILTTESNPGSDAFVEMQSSLRARLEAWQQEAAMKLEAVVKEAREDVWGYAANLATQPARRHESSTSRGNSRPRE